LNIIAFFFCEGLTASMTYLDDKVCSIDGEFFFCTERKRGREAGERKRGEGGERRK